MLRVDAKIWFVSLICGSNEVVIASYLLPLTSDHYTAVAGNEHQRLRA